MQPMTETPFKFKYVRNQQAQGLAAKKAAAGPNGLDLNGQSIRYEDILDTTTRYNRLLLVLGPNVQLGEKVQKMLTGERALVLEVSKVKAADLERQIDRCTSAIAAERHRQEMVAAGQGELFCTVACPVCGATIDMSRIAKTSYLYCRYCGSVLDRRAGTPAQPEGYGICDECHMFGRLRSYTVFYFYFLLVVYGFSYRQRQMCDTCAEHQAPKTLLLNLIFILGIPSAIYMWIKAGAGRDPEWKDLAKANGLARKGKYQEADAIYGRLMERHPEHPGLLLDQGIGHLLGKDGAGCVAHLNDALKACDNYLPALSLMEQLRQAAQQREAAGLR